MSHLIFFIAALVAVSVVVSVVSSSLKTLGYAIEEKAERSALHLSSYVVIAEAYYFSDTNQLRIYLKNVGKTNLTVNYFDFFLDGRFLGSCSAGVSCKELGSADKLLVPEELLEVNVDNITLSPGAYRLTVVGEYGVRAEYDLVVE